MFSLVVRPLAVRAAYSRMAERASAAEANVLAPSIGTDVWYGSLDAGPSAWGPAGPLTRKRARRAGGLGRSVHQPTRDWSRLPALLVLVRLRWLGQSDQPKFVPAVRSPGFSSEISPVSRSWLFPPMVQLLMRRKRSRSQSIMHPTPEEACFTFTQKGSVVSSSLDQGLETACSIVSGYLWKLRHALHLLVKTGEVHRGVRGVIVQRKRSL